MDEAAGWLSALAMMQAAPIVVPIEIVLWGLGGIFAVMGILVGMIWSKHNEEIVELNKKISAINQSIDGMVGQEEYEQNRREMRQGIIDLHTKIEGYDKEAQRRHGDVMKVLLEMKSR